MGWDGFTVISGRQTGTMRRWTDLQSNEGGCRWTITAKVWVYVKVARGEPPMLVDRATVTLEVAPVVLFRKGYVPLHLSLFLTISLDNCNSRCWLIL